MRTTTKAPRLVSFCVVGNVAQGWKWQLSRLPRQKRGWLESLTDHSTSGEEARP